MLCKENISTNTYVCILSYTRTTSGGNCISFVLLFQHYFLFNFVFVRVQTHSEGHLLACLLTIFLYLFKCMCLQQLLTPTQCRFSALMLRKAVNCVANLCLSSCQCQALITGAHTTRNQTAMLNWNKGLFNGYIKYEGKG